AYTLETPVVWTENFYKMGDGSNYPSSDWITYGNGADVNDLEKFMFENPKDGPYFVIFDQGSQSMAMATTDFVGNVPADQWLVSPEVEIPYDNMTLALDVCTYTFKGQLGVYPPNAKSGVNPYRIMISESGGVEKSDFKEIFSGSVNSDLTKETFESYERVFNVNGYKGKKVRFAFVVTGSNNGMTGFTNIRLGQYTFAVTSDMNSPYAEVGKPISIDFNTRMKAPVPTPYLNCEVYINDEKVKEQKIKSAFGSVTSYKTVLKRIQMENVYTPESDDPIVYKLVVTPDFEGAIPSVIEGGIVFQKVTYPSNVVVEEFTGSQCGWCPRGISALEYYHDTYKG
ncbi:MAG: choice-of-anchor J domain-containing protein, partial [Muribaculaceae bacterium]|nr:choice-of-anchor J domain-containing protein [Muribaculaceae bacterium]